MLIKNDSNGVELVLDALRKLATRHLALLSEGGFSVSEENVSLDNWGAIADEIRIELRIQNGIAGWHNGNYGIPFDDAIVYMMALYTFETLAISSKPEHLVQCGAFWRDARSCLMADVAHKDLADGIAHLALCKRDFMAVYGLNISPAIRDHYLNHSPDAKVVCPVPEENIALLM